MASQNCGRAWAPRFFANGLALAMALISRTAPADEIVQGVDLSVVRGAGAGSCVAAEILKEEVSARLGRDPFTPPIRQHIECLVVRVNDRFVVSLYERGPQGQLVGDREISVATADCRELDDALALAVTLLIDPEYLVRRADTSTGASSEQPKVSHWDPAQTALTDFQTPNSAERLRTKVTILGSTGQVRPTAFSPAGDSRVTLGIGASQGLLPGLGPDLTLSLQRRVIGIWHAQLSTLYSPEREVARDTPTAGFGLTALKLAGCVEAISRVAPIGCAGLAAGALHSVVYDQRPVNPGDRGWAAVSLDGGARAILGPVVLEVRGQLYAPLVRWKFSLLSGTRVYREDVVTRGLSVAIGVHFP